MVTASGQSHRAMQGALTHALVPVDTPGGQCELQRVEFTCCPGMRPRRPLGGSGGLGGIGVAAWSLCSPDMTGVRASRLSCSLAAPVTHGSLRLDGASGCPIAWVIWISVRWMAAIGMELSMSLLEASSESGQTKSLEGKLWMRAASGAARGRPLDAIQ